MSKKKTAKTAKARPSTSKAACKGAKPADPPRETAPLPAAAPPKPTKVNITAAKGRPMLTWVGKRPLSHVTAFPAQLVERHDALRIVGIDPENIEASKDKMQLFRDLRSQCNEECWSDAPFIGLRAPEVGGLLLHGDNKDVLASLLANGFRGKVSLIYIDPPFDSAADYVRSVSLRGAQATAQMQGASYTLGEQVQYTDIWVNDNYLQFLYERLLLIRELLSDNGSIFLQCDHRKNHHIRCLLDEVFGADNFRNEIATRRGTTSVQAQFDEIESLIPAYYTTLFYAKSRDTKLPILKLTRVIVQPGKWDTFWRNHDRRTMRYQLCGVTPTHGQWRWAPERGRRAEANYKHYLDTYASAVDLDTYLIEHLSTKGEMLDMVRLGDDGTVQCYIPPQADRLANNVWLDFPHMGSITDYPTEKAEQMLDRLISWTTRPGDLIMDCFLGSGTTAAVAQKLGRRWIGCDINKGAIQTTVKRLRGIIAEQIQTARKAGAEARQGTLMDTATEGETPALKPCAFGFTLWRVNDYDLQIQHNEAVNLACEHIGIERTRSDSYFEGTLGKKLVKIIPFGHPLTPLDLEELKRELEARPDEDRTIVVVCLGMELAAKAWIEDWNRLRKGKSAVNKIDVIELRTDPKYGRFIKHEPASARVKITRQIVARASSPCTEHRRDAGATQESRIVVEIEDFISPTIVERLSEQAGVVSPKIDDWRAMVDCVYIDPTYNGSALNVALADVPERKADFVSGKYELPAPADETTVAVKIVDMLGEEVLITQQV